MPTAVSSSFDVAFWFIERGRADSQQLSSLKLQRMLFLAQAYFAGSTRGERLMPSVFVVTEQGPVEPNLLRLFDNTVPAIETATPRPAVVKFLEGIWRTFGARTLKELDEIVTSSPPVRDAMQTGTNTEVSPTALFNHYRNDKRQGDVMQKVKPDEAKVAIPKTHRGKPVTKWVPGAKKSG